MARPKKQTRDPKTGKFVSQKRTRTQRKTRAQAKRKRAIRSRKAPSGRKAPKRPKVPRPRYVKKNPPMTARKRDELEMMVDRFSLQAVLDGLSEIAAEKGAHFRSLEKYLGTKTPVGVRPKWEAMAGILRTTASKAKDRKI